jgi:hypothetical protein
VRRSRQSGRQATADLNGSTPRASGFREGDKIGAKAPTALIRAAVAVNKEKANGYSAIDSAGAVMPALVASIHVLGDW